MGTQAEHRDLLRRMALVHPPARVIAYIKVRRHDDAAIGPLAYPVPTLQLHGCWLHVVDVMSWQRQ